MHNVRRAGMLSVFIRDVNAQAEDIAQDCKKNAMTFKEQVTTSICDRSVKKRTGTYAF